MVRHSKTEVTRTFWLNISYFDARILIDSKFVDANGDGLPDAIQARASDGRLMTWINTGLGFADKPIESLAGDGQAPQNKYFHLAQPLDWDGDSIYA